MENIKIFNNPEFGEIRTVEFDGKFYAVGVDVARALEYANPSKAVSDHCKGDFLNWEVKDSSGRIQETRLIPEGDIYRLTIKASEQSRNKNIKNKANKFESWIFDEVLPSIRQTGTYSCNQSPLTEHPGEVANLIKVLSNRMDKQGIAPYKSAEVVRMVCEQYGIRLPECFVAVPEYEQVNMASLLEV